LIVDLNPIRELITVSLEDSDEILPAQVQRLLREGNVPFSTSDRNGVWEVKSLFILPLHGALEGIGSQWTDRALDRVANVQEDIQAQENPPSPYLTSRHSLATLDGILRKPFDEQAEAARYMSAPGVRRFALFWKPGTGKTGALILAAHELLTSGVISGVLVVAERPIAIDAPWFAEINAWIPPEYLGENRIGRVRGNKRDRLGIYLSNPTWLVIHYSHLMLDLDSIRGWAGRMRSSEPPVVIFDESDLIKNRSASRSRAAMTVRQSCGRCWIASGTPAPNAPVDYEHQMSVLCGYPVDLGMTGERRHDSLVVIHEFERGVYYLQQDNPRKMPETTTPVTVPLTASQRESYDQLAGDLVSDLNSMDDTTYERESFSIMARRARLLRICSDPAHETLGDLDFNDPAKAIKLDELLDGILSDDDEKVVIWTKYVDTARNLFTRYHEKWGASLLIGGEGSPDDLDRNGTRVLIATIARGSSSISLTPARNAIYESLDDISRNFAQSMARINRTGQDKDCRYWVLISEDTLEEDQYESIMAKINLSEETLEEIGSPGRAQLIEQLKRSLKILT